MNAKTNYSDLRVNEQQGKASTREEREKCCVCLGDGGKGRRKINEWGFETKSNVL